MTHDIFDNRILCGKCNNEMHKANILKDGFLLRAMMCKKCNEKILHPLDIENYNKFINLKNKHFSVKMRLVGNSYAVSIPKEIVSFMDGQKKTFNEFDKMVNLCFEEMGRLSLNFGNEGDKKSARIIKAKEIRVVKNNKPVFHSRQFYDSAHPERNQSKIYKSREEK